MIIANGTTPVIMFLMVDETDDETAETGLSPAAEISKNGGAFASVTNAISEVSDGWYKVTLTATETNTDGMLVIRATAAGADEWRDIHQVIAVLPSTAPTAVQNRQEMDSNSTQLAAIVADTNELQTDDVPGLIAALPTAVENRTEMDSNSTQLAAIVADTNELQTDDVPGLIAALNDISTAEVNTEVDTAFTTIMADSVPADGTIPTREQALYMITQFLLERAVSGTTVTVKKVDGSTSLMTLTLSDATTPTSITRAT